MSSKVEVSISTAYSDTDYKSYELHLKAPELMHGALDFDDLNHGWVRPWRFVPQQRQALCSASAWYPGVYRQMATCTTGMELAFESNCTELHIELMVDAFPTASLNVFRAMGTDVAVVQDDFALEIDGELCRYVHLEETNTPYVIDLNFGKSLVGAVHTVRLLLPSMRGAALRYVCGKSAASKDAFVRPVAYERQLLVLGDSVAQGFCAEQPDGAWPSLVARQLKAELINQSVGGQVFQPTALMGLESVASLSPDVVIVPLGVNYKYGRCMEQMVAREIGAYLVQVAKLWPKATLLVVAPNKQGVAAVKGSCFERVPALITHAYQTVRERRLKDNNKAPVALKTAPELAPELLADSDTHPTTQGAAQLAKFVLDELTKLDCNCYLETGQFGRCGVCAAQEVSGGADEQDLSDVVDLAEPVQPTQTKTAPATPLQQQVTHEPKHFKGTDQ